MKFISHYNYITVYFFSQQKYDKHFTFFCDIISLSEVNYEKSKTRKSNFKERKDN